MPPPSERSPAPESTAAPDAARQRIPGARTASRWLPVAALALVALTPLLFQHRLDAPLGSDARLLTHRNRYMQDVEGLRSVWTRDFFEGAETGQVTYRSGYYRPVTNTFLWFAHSVAGTSARAYNLLQMLLHGLCAALVVLVFFLLTRKSGFAQGQGLDVPPDAPRWSDDEAAWMAAGSGVLFAAHPIQAFAATEPAAVADVLFPVFFLLGMATFELALSTRRRRARAGWVVATALLYACAVLSKEMGATLPAVLVLQVVRRRARGELSLDALAWTLPAWAVLGGYLAWRFGVLDLPVHANRYAAEHGWPAVLAAGPKSFLIYVSKVLAPFGADHPELNPTLVNRLVPPWTDPLAWAGVAVVGAFLAAAVWLWRRRPHVAFWSAFTLVTFSPLLFVERMGRGLAPDVILTQERWFYLPFVGLVALLVLGARTLHERLESRGTVWAARVATLALLLTLGYAARLHAGKHDDPFAQLRTLYLFPEERLSRQELANRLLLYAHFVALPQGDTADALERGSRAVRLTPDSPLSAASYATLLAERGRWSEIRRLLEPWYRPSPEILSEAARTHPRVYDDLNRSGARLTLLLGRALTHTRQPDRGLGLVCEARRAGADASEVRRALEEARRAGVTLARCPTDGG